MVRERDLRTVCVDAAAVAHDALRAWLEAAKVLVAQPPPEAVLEACEAALGLQPVAGAGADAYDSDAEPEDLGQYYPCGQAGCCKTFSHEHVTSGAAGAASFAAA